MEDPGLSDPTHCVVVATFLCIDAIMINKRCIVNALFSEHEAVGCYCIKVITYLFVRVATVVTATMGSSQAPVTQSRTCVPGKRLCSHQIIHRIKKLWSAWSMAGYSGLKPNFWCIDTRMVKPWSSVLTALVRDWGTELICFPKLATTTLRSRLRNTILHFVEPPHLHRPHHQYLHFVLHCCPSSLVLSLILTQYTVSFTATTLVTTYVNNDIPTLQPNLV